MTKTFHLKGNSFEGLVEAGCDEAGRGPLAGPVFAAAVILPEGFFHPLLNDSKRMTERARETLRPIIEREAVAWAVEAVSPEEIDRINILNASITGMQRAVVRLSVKPDILLIDGNRFKPMKGYAHNNGNKLFFANQKVEFVAALVVVIMQCVPVSYKFGCYKILCQCPLVDRNVALHDLPLYRATPKRTQQTRV